MATIPTPITPLPTPVPQRSDPANFAVRADVLLTALPGFVLEVNNTASNVYSNTQEAASAANAAMQSAATAASASDVATGAANFVGMWASLTGALTLPATVKHNGRFWLLLHNLPNVALSEPGVSADWTTGDAGALIRVVASSALITPGPVYSVVTPGITLTIPASLGIGDQISVRNTTAGVIYIDWNGNTLKGQVPVSPMRIPRLRGFSVISNGSTLA